MGRDTDFDFGANAPPSVDPDTGGMCQGRVVCVHCGRYYGRCNQVEAELQNGGPYNMLPSAGSKVNTATKGGSQKSGIPYINVTELTSDKATARVIDVRLTEQVEGRQNFSDIRLKIAIKGMTRLYGLKTTNPEYDKLLSAFGQDETMWPGREFYIYAEQDEFDGKLWIRVDPQVQKDAPAGKKGRG